MDLSSLHSAEDEPKYETGDLCLGMSIWHLSGCYLKRERKFFSSTAYLAFLQTPFRFRDFSTCKLKQSNDDKSLNKALRIIDVVSPKTTHSDNQHRHLQLIQDLLQTYSEDCPSEEKPSNAFIVSYSRNQDPSDQMPPSFSFKDDGIRGVSKLHREGLRVDVAVLPYGLSVCGYSGNLHFGTQLQCLAIRNGFLVNVYVGSSLISMYSKCGDLRSASMVFEEMPVRNVVSWTALISGFAQNYHVEVCLELYSQMRHSTIKPNDFTLTSLLSACVGNGSLGQGKITHCLAILSGFDSHVHVSNALVSMYCKCGDVEDAFSVFEAMHNKDVVSWNTMIAGYALNGLAWKAIDLFELMRKQKMKPDKITFLGVLSSCRHAGLVKQGHMYFNSMVSYSVEPDLGHYSCMVDLLGRAGLVEEGRNFILGMPIEPNAVIWGSLLSSCRLYNNVWIGIEAAENRLALDPSCAATHVQLAKLYARVGMWDQVAKVWKMMKDTELKTNPGYSWIEIGNETISFRVDDTSNSRMSEVLFMLEVLKDDMTSDYVPECDEELDSFS